MRPEVQAEDVSFPGQQVVADIEPPHGRQVAAHDPVGNERREVGSGIPAMLDIVQSRRSDFESRFVFFVPLGDPGVEIPAVVVEPGRARELANFVQPLVLELPEADGDVGHLHAGVIDVVLDFDLAAEEAQQPAKGVAERCVAKMSDVRRLVRVDRGVLDDRLPGPAVWNRSSFWRQPSREVCRTIQEEVDVAVRRRLDACEPVDLPQGADDLLRNGARGLAQPSRQFEGERDRQITERPAGRDLHRDRGEHRIVGRNVVQARDGAGHVVSDGVLDW